MEYADKILKITGEVDPDMLSSIAKQLEELDVRKGDALDVIFDSPGGSVDIGFSIASLFDLLQNDGVKLRAIAEGNVWSAAILPFLSIEDRCANESASPSFIVHKALYPYVEDADRDTLESLINDIDEYTEMMYDYYLDHGVPESVAKHLKEGDQLTIEKPKDMVEAGMISETIGVKPVVLSDTLYGRTIRAISNKIYNMPKTYFIKNHLFIKNKLNMNEKRVEEIIEKKFGDFENRLDEKIANLFDGIKNAMMPPNIDGDQKGEPMNKVEAMTSEELAKLDDVMFKTPASVDGAEDVKYLAHPTKELVKDHFVVPTMEDGTVVKLPEGDHNVAVDGKEYTIHSTGSEWYLHTSASAGETENLEIPGEEEKEEDIKKEIEEEMIDKVAPPQNKTPETKAPTNKVSKAPTVENKVPVFNNEKAMELMAAMEAYGCKPERITNQ